MSRVCLKKKEIQKKITLCSTGEHFNNENIRLDTLTDVSNTPINKPKAQDHSYSLKLLEEFKIQYY
jgi:hypothetical protein